MDRPIVPSDFLVFHRAISDHPKNFASDLRRRRENPLTMASIDNPRGLG
jgi:hypothetical protein